MKQTIITVLKLVIVAVLAFFAFSCNAQDLYEAKDTFITYDDITSDDIEGCNSLSAKTGEQVSLFDALAIYCNRNPTEVTVSEFRAMATSYANACGMVYDRTAKGNIALVQHILCIGAPVTIKTTTAPTIDSTDMSPFQKEHFAKAGYVLVASVSIDTLLEEAQQAYSATVNHDTVALFTMPVISATNHLYTVNRIDTVTTVIETVDTIVTDFCNCSEDVPMEQLWNKYMGLREEIRRSKDATEKVMLSACRIKVGMIVRSNHRYGGKLKAVKSVTSIEPIYHSVPAEFCGRLTVGLNTNNKATKSKGGSGGLAKMRWNDFWKGVKTFFLSIGSCKRGH